MIMAVLTRKIIIEKIENKELIISPYDEKSIGPASIDLHLDNQFRTFRTIRSIYHLTSKADFHDLTKLVTIKDYFLLMPGQTAHGITIEKIKLPQNICGRIEGRSSLGRLGLMVHITASFVQPGSSGKQVLEFNNAGPIPLAIHPGINICQLILEETLGQAKYQGKFVDQTTP